MSLIFVNSNYDDRFRIQSSLTPRFDKKKRNVGGHIERLCHLAIVLYGQYIQAKRLSIGPCTVSYKVNVLGQVPNKPCIQGTQDSRTLGINTNMLEGQASFDAFKDVNVKFAILYCSR